LPSNCKLESNLDKATPIDINSYQQQIGSLIYITIFTRPDLAFAVNYLARFMSNPSILHFKSLDYLWGYIKNTKNLGLIYNLNPNLQSLSIEQLVNNLVNKLDLIGSTDADWGGNITSRKSTTGYIFYINNRNNKANNSAIAWLSKLQKTVALSSCEAEYMAYKEAAKESIYLNSFIKELFKEINTIFNSNNTIYTDSLSAIELSKNPTYYARTKHVDIRYHFIREKVADNTIKLVYQSTNTLLADNLTKPTSIQKIKDFKTEIGLVKIE
jgi:hypothetical protein